MIRSTRSSTAGGASSRAPLTALLVLALLMTATTSAAAEQRDLSSLCPPDEVPASGFRDVAGPHATAIDCLAWLDVTRGRTAELFGTGLPLTRAQLASLVVRGLELVDDLDLPEGGAAPFPDVAGSTHGEAISRLAALDPPILRGHADGTFRPLAPVTRAQAAAVLARVHAHLAERLDEVDPLPPGDPGRFDDLLGTTHADDVAALAGTGIVAGHADGTFRPTATLTRGQAASLLARHLDVLAELGALAGMKPPDEGPPPTGNVWIDERRVANIAHAGGIFEAPQNTLYAFRTAPGRGADVVEMDVHATADGHVVAIHDSTVDRTTDGTGCVVEHTLEEIQQLDAAHTHVDGQSPQDGLDDDAYPYRGIATGEHAAPEGFEASDFTVPTLDAIIGELSDELLVIEIKPTETETRGGTEHDCPAVLEGMDPDERPDPVEEVARLIEEHGAHDRVIVASFIDDIMDRFVEAAPEVDTAFPLLAGFWFYVAFQNDDPDPPNPHGHVALQAPVGLEFSGIELEASPELVEYAHEHGVAVHFWTINDPEDMETLLGWGADGIITDEVRMLDQLMDQRGDPRPGRR